LFGEITVSGEHWDTPLKRPKGDPSDQGKRGAGTSADSDSKRTVLGSP